MRPTRARSAAAALLWVVVAAGALVVGLTAVGAVGSGITGDGLRPLTAAEVDARLAALPATSAPATSVPQPPASSPPPAADPQAVVVSGAPGGTVVVRCEGTTPRVVSASPAQGFELKDSGDGGPRVRFESDDLKVDVRLTCTNGTPAGEVRVEHDD